METDKLTGIRKAKPRPTRSKPPEDCPVKDRCRRARAAVCLDCGAKRPPRKRKSDESSN